MVCYFAIYDKVIPTFSEKNNLIDKHNQDGSIMFMGISLGEKAHQNVLDLINTFDTPVTKEELLWMVDYGPGKDRYADLGPSPRRQALYAILGDLIDHQLIVLEESWEGFLAQSSRTEPREGTCFVGQVSVRTLGTPLE